MLHLGFGRRANFPQVKTCNKCGTKSIAYFCSLLPCSCRNGRIVLKEDGGVVLNDKGESHVIGKWWKEDPFTLFRASLRGVVPIAPGKDACIVWTFPEAEVGTKEALVGAIDRITRNAD